MTTTHSGRTFDRVPDPSRNADYPIRALIEPARITRSRVAWRTGTILDQGRDGACVGFGWTQEALSSPVRVNLSGVTLPTGFGSEPNGFAKQVYLNAQRIDQWPGGEYSGASPRYSGTSVVAGAKEMQALGFLGSYRWAFSTDELRDALLLHGPAVIGVDWLDGMFDAPGGVLHVTGSVAGGHCVLVNAYAPDRDLGSGPEPAFRLTNSWGTGWGVNGSAWLSVPDMAKLIDNQGEVCVPTGRHYGPSVT